MGIITKEDKLRLIGEQVSQTATLIANEEIANYEKDDPSALITTEMRDIICQRSVSELMFRTCNFKCPENIDEQDFRDTFNNWFIAEEETKLRNVCRTNTREQVEKNRPVDEGELTFTEHFLRQVREGWNRK